MDTVGDGQDLVLDDAVPCRIGGFRVQLAHGIGTIGQAQAEGGHVELAGVVVRPAPKLEDALHGHATGVEQRPGNTSDEIDIEALVAGRDRGVDREHAVAPDLRPGILELYPGRDVLTGAFGKQERRVALVEMPDRRCQPQGADRPHAPDTEHEFLMQAHLPTADVQDVGDRPVLDRVLGDIRVQQQDRHPSDLSEPHRDGQVPTGELDRDGQRQAVLVLHPRQRQAAQVVVGVSVLLVAVGIDLLAEVTLAIEQPDPDERQGHVAGGFHMIAGQDAQSARVDPDRLVEAIFGAEVGDRSGELGAVLAPEPVTGAIGHVLVEVGQDIVIFGQELLVVEQA